MDKMRSSYNNEEIEEQEPRNDSYAIQTESIAEIPQDLDIKDLKSGNFQNQIYNDSVMKSLEVSEFDPF